MKHAHVALCLTAVVSIAAQSPSFSLYDLKNTTYSGFNEVRSPVPLKNGRWESSSARLSIAFVGDAFATGDLNGDGIAEAAVLLAESTGGSGEQVYLAVLAATAGQPRNIATLLLGPEVKLRKLRIAGRTVFVDVLQAGAYDAMCCPSDLATRTFTLNGDDLEEGPTTDTAKLTQAAMTGDWVLRSWNIGEPASLTPALTLRFERAQFAGSAGCNRYAATVTTGERAGTASVVAAASTQMACGNQIMSIEGRFLRLLSAVTNYSFWAGQLALSYDIGGKTGTMLFEPNSTTSR